MWRNEQVTRNTYLGSRGSEERPAALKREGRVNHGICGWLSQKSTEDAFCWSLAWCGCETNNVGVERVLKT